ncbi:transporter [Sediminibacterium roseum]|uniref:Transporter n=1 Tax=Sediminibacterium roseum TaxID=1978412 RepID=A0ABX0A0A6_9BACT|nr:transporter [Sediminibacterium roseum]NCI52012.1 transporter [Sediminibacterium roseum]
MKHCYKIIVCVLIILLPALGFACDICGCGAGNNYIGILPEFQKHIFGFRYRSNSMLTHVGIGGTTSYLTTEEHYNTLEAWGGWNISNRFRLMASVPYAFNEKYNQGVTQTKSGLGDISVSGLYELINKRHTVSTKLVVQSLWVGAGLKFASGKYSPTDKAAGGQSTNLFQLGTGSFDLNLNAMYDLRIQDFGVNLNAAYKINTANQHHYQYGNKVNGSLQGYYKFRIQNKLLLAPNAGLQYERSDLDRDENLLVNVSGGNLLLGTVGLESGIGKLSFGINWQTPLSQNLANGIVRAQNRAMVHLAISL